MRPATPRQEKVFKGIDKPFSIKGFHGNYALLAGGALIGMFLITVALSFILANQLVTIPLCIAVAAVLLVTIYKMNKRFPVGTFEEWYSRKDRPKRLLNNNSYGTDLRKKVPDSID